MSLCRTGFCSLAEWRQPHAWTCMLHDSSSLSIRQREIPRTPGWPAKIVMDFFPLNLTTLQ